MPRRWHFLALARASRNWSGARRASLSVLSLAVLILAVLAIAAAQSREAPFGYATEQSVREACGEKLRSNDGAFGCTVVQDGEMRDYSCNSNPRNGHVGCRVLFRGTAPKPGIGTGGLSKDR